MAVPTVVALFSAGLLATSPSAWAQPALAADGDADLTRAFNRFQQAGRDNQDAVTDAAKRFARLSAAHPDDPVLRAYDGAATSMRALTPLLPWRKMSHTEDGLAQIDKALAQLGAAHDAPLHRGVSAQLETRYIAAATFLSLPSMFNRNDRGRTLLAQVLSSLLFDAAPAAFKATVWLRSARLAEDDAQPAQARAWYQEVVTSNAPQAAAARDRLKGL